MAVAKTTEIAYLAELERAGWLPILPSSSDEVKIKCPLHDDKDPSASLNLRSGLWKCFVCASAGGDFISLWAAIGKNSRGVAFAELSQRYDLETVKTVEAAVVERMHQAIWAQPHMLKELYDRGLTDEDVRKYRLGFDGGRIIIPIKNDGGVYVNLRKYLPGAPGPDKMKNLPGRGKPPRLFPIEQVSSYDDIVLTGGECKAIVAARQLNPHNVGAVCVTAGEGNWHPSLLQRFHGKRAWVVMDVDKKGREAAQRLAAILRPVCKWVGVVELSLDHDKYPKGDVNDFVAKEKGDLWPLLGACPEWFPPTMAPTNDPDEEPAERKFSETVRSENVGKRMRFTGVVAAAVDKPFIVPKRIHVACTRDQDCCVTCGVFAKPDQKTFDVSAESPAILRMVGAKDTMIDPAVRDALAVPKRCDAVTFVVEDHYHVTDARINPSLDITNRDNDRTMQQAFFVECDADLNTTYDVVGRMYPHPLNQQAALVLSRSKTTHDALSRYEPRRLGELTVFQPEEWSLASLSSKLDEIYADLEANVTHIWFRRDIHRIIDLAYHSPLLLNVDGRDKKGWVEVLIVGDSSNGKTETMKELMRHYGLGERAECKNASAAGLIGGLKQIGTQWYVSWGIMPTHDRRLVWWEELKGLDTRFIARMTDMRSSGIAELDKIEKRRTHARVRVVAMSNPRDDRRMSSFTFGVEAVADLIGAPEDVRRFDAALCTADWEVDPKAVSETLLNPPKIRHVYTGDLCRELILWAWTRHSDQVVFPDESYALISKYASQMCDEYSSEIPLVDPGSMRLKLARLSASIACRTFSCGNVDPLTCVVRECHVQWVREFLDRVYGGRATGYKFYSQSVKRKTGMIDPQAIKDFLATMQGGNEIVKSLLYTDQFDLTDLSDWSSYDRTDAQRLLSLLVRKRAIRRIDNVHYAKTADFIDYLKKLENEDIEKRPDHVKEDTPKEEF